MNSKANSVYRDLKKTMKEKLENHTYLDQYDELWVEETIGDKSDLIVEGVIRMFKNLDNVVCTSQSYRPDIQTRFHTIICRFPKKPITVY